MGREKSGGECGMRMGRVGGACRVVAETGLSPGVRGDSDRWSEGD